MFYYFFILLSYKIPINMKKKRVIIKLHKDYNTGKKYIILTAYKKPLIMKKSAANPRYRSPNSTL